MAVRMPNRNSSSVLRCDNRDELQDGLHVGGELWSQKVLDDAYLGSLRFHPLEFLAIRLLVLYKRTVTALTSV